jgi:hypothetical protein
MSLPNGVNLGIIASDYVSERRFTLGYDWV